MKSTKNMKPEWFSAEDLCKIISCLKDSGVRVLKYRGLEVDCANNSVVARESMPSHSFIDRYSLATDPEPVSSHRSPEPAKTVPLTTPEEDYEARIELLKIEDPEAYEQMIAEGEIDGQADIS